MSVPCSGAADFPVHLPWIRRYKYRFGLQIIAEGLFAIDTAPRAAGNALAAVRQTVGHSVVAIDLAGAIAELLYDFLAEF